MKAIIISVFIVLCTIVFATNKSISIDISFSPAGSFQINSKRVKRKALIKGAKFSASNIKIPVKSLKTGIQLRDSHLQKTWKCYI